MKSEIYRNLLSLLSGRGSTRKLTVLYLHRVALEARNSTGDLGLADFERLLDFLVAHMTVLPLNEAIQGLKRGSLPKRAVSLTFDDGYFDWTDIVAPSLLRRNLHATFFVTTEQLTGPDHWNERVAAAVRALPDGDLTLPFGLGRYGNLEDPARRARLTEELQARLKYMRLGDRGKAIEELEGRACKLLTPAKRFGIESLRSLHSQGFGIGAHTIRHPILNKCDDIEAMNEIGGCREILQELVRAPIDLFAYPNGKPRLDYSAKHVEMVEKCGYQAAFSTGGGVVSVGSDMFQLPRFAPWSFDTARMVRQIASNYLAKESRVFVSKAEQQPAQSNVKILLVASTFPPIHGGSAVVYDSLCRNLPRGSIRVLTARRNYLTGREISDWAEHDAQAPYPVHRVDLLRPLLLSPPRNILVSAYRFLIDDLRLYGGILWKSARLVRRHRINVVCIGELVTGSWLGILLRKLFGCKMVIYVHGEEITTTTNGRLHGNRRAEFLNASDKIVAVSSFTCDALRNLMSVSSSKIALIHNGVDTERFAPGDAPDALIQRYGLQGKRVVLTVGRMVPRKGMDMAIKAIGLASQRVPNIRHLIVGDGPMRSELERLVSEEELTDVVTIIGGVSDQELVDFFRACEVFLLPNRTMPDGDTEGFGLVFREANACGKPVIGGKAGGVVEAVVDGESGLLVDGTDVLSIAHAIERLLSDDALRQKLGSQGMKLAHGSNTKMAANRFLEECERIRVI